MNEREQDLGYLLLVTLVSALTDPDAASIHRNEYHELYIIYEYDFELVMIPLKTELFPFIETGGTYPIMDLYTKYDQLMEDYE